MESSLENIVRLVVARPDLALLKKSVIDKTVRKKELCAIPLNGVFS